MERRQLWDGLLSFGVLQMPWMIIGDFNTIRHDGERRGGCPRSAKSNGRFFLFYSKWWIDRSAFFWK
jgi:hypothetical protein